MNQRVPILVYHHVYPEGDPELAAGSRRRATGIIGEAEFRRQMSYLVAEGWQVISTTRLVEWLGQGATIPGRAAVLHFDNGWLDTYTVSWPALHEHGLTATCYLISDVTAAASEDRPVTVSTTTEGMVAKQGLTWEHAAELLAEGWEMGAHTATHPRLAELYTAAGDAGVIAEIERSHTVYGEALGFVPTHFAYPSGSRSAQTDALLAPYYRSLRRWERPLPPQGGFTDRDTSPLALECQNIDNTVSFRDFTRLFEDLQTA
ncbi:MAG: hypothetical protein CL878_06150 [Dehalococcoidia bacterium]|nr:hypothetical protein [Dehalococcoidia bacterium]